MGYAGKPVCENKAEASKGKMDKHPGLILLATLLYCLKMAGLFPPPSWEPYFPNGHAVMWFSNYTPGRGGEEDEERVGRSSSPEVVLARGAVWIHLVYWPPAKVSLKKFLS